MASIVIISDIFASLQTLAADRMPDADLAPDLLKASRDLYIEL